MKTTIVESLGLSEADVQIKITDSFEQEYGEVRGLFATIAFGLGIMCMVSTLWYW